MKVAIITENFKQPWSPNDLEIFLGGSQECIVLLAEALSRFQYSVSVFTIGPTECKEERRNGIVYQDYKNFSLNDNYDNIIMFKVNPVLEDKRLENINVIYWSADIEIRPKNKYIKKLVCLTNYHKNRCGWDDVIVIPLGIDTKSLSQNQIPKNKNTMVYCSSLDRGLNILLANWKKIKQNYPELKLYITYGFKIVKQFASDIELLQINNQETSLKNICNNLDITYLGYINKDKLEELYWSCEYWCLPLNNPDSELFCFNAVKSQFCECIPVVYRKGALQETVSSYIDFDDFTNGSKIKREFNEKVPIYTWDEVVKEYWSKILV